MTRQNKNLSDQQILWNSKYQKREFDSGKNKSSLFARNVVKDLSSHLQILDLGCGIGTDARYFAKNGFKVTATDISDVAIQRNSAENSLSNVTFMVLDIGTAYPFHNEQFDAVFAQLSLHYFDRILTKQIFHEIARVLNSTGRLYFSVPSTNDPLFGEGEKIEENMYLHKNHIRHFFSANDIIQLLGDTFEVRHMAEVSGRHGSRKTKVMECWAVKKEDEATEYTAFS